MPLALTVTQMLHPQQPVRCNAEDHLQLWHSWQPSLIVQSWQHFFGENDGAL